METLGNLYGNRSRNITRRVKLTEMLNWERFFYFIAVEQLPEHELECGSESAWERGEDETVAE
jgi:hypothetical protein